MTRTAPETAEPGVSPTAGRIGRVLALSLVAGLVLALLLVLIVFPGAREHVTTGVLLLAFAAGWALLAALSTWRTDQPQRWAWVPAIAMGATGAALLLLAPGDDMLRGLGWVWPPLLLVLVIWCVRASRRRLHSRTRAGLVYPVLAVLALTALGGGVETALEASSDTARAADADMYVVAGHRMYLHCEGTGAPTVVLSNGLFEHAASWAWVQRAVAADTRVCGYDRAGEGFSEPATGPQDGRALAADLHALLARAHVPGPYVLAGHSVGGTYALVYAARYPADVGGVALVDSATPRQFALPDYGRFYALLRRGSGVLPTLARTGLVRVALGSGFAGLPPDARHHERAFASTARDYRGARDEISQLPTTFQQAGHLDSLADTPVYVLTAGQGQQAGWAEAQNRLATLSTNITHRTVVDATHAALLEDRRTSAGTSDAIRAVVAAVRAGTSLPAG